MRSLVCILAAVAFAGTATRVSASTFKVGSDGACTHTSVQSAIDAAAANGPAQDLIIVANNQIYTAVSLSIEAHSVILRGGYADCNAVSQSGSPTVLDGSGGAPGSVISINQANSVAVRLDMEDIEVRGGDSGGDGQGGAIDAGPGSTVGLTNSRLIANSATHGGGIYLQGGAGAVEFYLSSGSSIEGNQASGDGGAIACQAGANSGVFMHSGTLRQNWATRGGGVFLSGGCSLFSYLGGATGGIVGNQASTYGGGVYAESQAYINFSYNVSERHGALIAGNSAGSDGGGLYLTNASTFVSREITIRDNQAGRHGGGVFVTNQASFDMRRDGALLNCPEHARCNRLSGNMAGVSDQVAQGSGGALYATAGSSATVRQAFVTGNSADLDAAVSGDGVNVQVGLESTQISGNSTASVTSGVIGAANGSQVAVLFSTITGNSFPTAALRSDSAALLLGGSIVREAQGLVFAGSSAPGLADCLLLHETNSIPASPRVVLGDPLFVNASAGDYHLRAASLARDFCDNNIAPQGADLDRVVRGGDDAAQANLHGPYDLGAFESDRIFSDGHDYLGY